MRKRLCFLSLWTMLLVLLSLKTFLFRCFLSLLTWPVSNGCLETIRNLILDSGAANLEALTAHGWEKVLRNMNGLLSTDVGSIKDLLSQLKCLESQQEQELEQIGRRIMETNAVPRSNGIDQNEEENLMDFQVTWDQIIYHSLFVWKQRNGSLTTFFSLIGIFQHSNLFYTAGKIKLDTFFLFCLRA